MGKKNHFGHYYNLFGKAIPVNIPLLEQDKKWIMNF